MINFQKGDLFDNLPDDRKILIPQINNDVGGWGSGFVLSLSKYSKIPELAYRKWHREGVWNETPFELGACQVLQISDNVFVANMIAQHKTVPHETIPIRYWALCSAMKKVQNECNNWEIDEIISPFFGTGLARGNKDFVATLINEIWVNNSIPVTIFEL